MRPALQPEPVVDRPRERVDGSGHSPVMRGGGGRERKPRVGDLRPAPGLAQEGEVHVEANPRGEPERGGAAHRGRVRRHRTREVMMLRSSPNHHVATFTF